MRSPTLGFPVAPPATDCAKHRLDGMVNLNAKIRCQHPAGCSRIPSYGIYNGPASHCSQHRLDGMINVVSKKCEHPAGCSKYPCFGFKGSSASHCAEHQLDGMVNLRLRDQYGISNRILSRQVHACMHVLFIFPTQYS